MWCFGSCPSIGIVVVLALAPVSVEAVVCIVPSGNHPTIQSAVDDLTCADVTIAAETLVESVLVDRSLSITGASSSTTIVEGRFVVAGASTEVTVSDLRIDAGAPSAAGCFTLALEVSDGARVTGNELVVLNADGDACLIFRDGFGSGGTGAWSNASP